MKSIILLAILSLCINFGNGLFGQRSISGKVVNINDSAIAGATISLKDSSTTTLSDENGAFSLPLSGNIAFIIVSYKGFNTQEILITKDTFVKVVLFEDKKTMDKDFRVRSSPGLEVSNVIDLNGIDRLEFGVNYLFSSWDRDKSDSLAINIKTKKPLVEDFRIFQIGPTVSFRQVSILDVPDEKEWQMRAGLIYNRISFEAFGLGITSRINGITTLSDQRRIQNNLGLESTLGLTFFGVINATYSRLINVENFTSSTNTPENVITISLNINASAFKYGLQGF